MSDQPLSLLEQMRARIAAKKQAAQAVDHKPQAVEETEAQRFERIMNDPECWTSSRFGNQRSILPR